MDRTLSHELLKKMKLGWNLGNTLDAPHGENSWGNPTTTREMIVKIHGLGFETLRLPVSWHCHVDENNIISPEWLDRVSEIVDYAYDDGMFVILNIHHDDWRFQPTEEGFAGGKEYIGAIWRQLSERFKGYGERLIFESMNEPRIVKSEYEWHLDFEKKVCCDAIEFINEYNKIFVETVRASGGGNAERFLMVPSYDAAPYYACSPIFKIPDDPADRIIVSAHAYIPTDLCLMREAADREFGGIAEKELDWIFKGLSENFVEKGVPVVIGEMGIVDKNNPDERRRWSEYFVAEALKKGMISVWWDNGGRDFRLFDRRNLRLYEGCEPVYEGLKAGLLAMK